MLTTRTRHTRLTRLTRLTSVTRTRLSFQSRRLPQVNYKVGQANMTEESHQSLTAQVGEPNKGHPFEYGKAGRGTNKYHNISV